MLPLALVLCAAIVGCMTVGALISCEVYNNYSFVDRSWSIVPFVYSSILASLPASGIYSLRPFVMAILTFVWGARLTYNFYRKGGYSAGAEDYRWPIIREQWKLPRFVWFLFNLLFTAAFQCVLLFLLVVPVYAATMPPVVSLPWSFDDLRCTLIFLGLLYLEGTADNQQFAFQTEKYARLAALQEKNPKATVSDLPEPYSHGFLSTGWFALCRHPNFFAEISMWWTMASFVAPHVPRLLWLPGPLLLTALFAGSTTLTENISAGKYPLYKVYQERTSMIIPWLPAQPVTLNDLPKDKDEKKEQ